MTKQEYKQLLNTDYWKGYSYAIIKERNFTCQDCNKYFPGQRNKLQIHHLKYKGNDTKPWSYDPDEIIVLCDECHRKRHGITNTTTTLEPEIQNWERKRTRQHPYYYNEDMSFWKGFFNGLFKVLKMALIFVGIGLLAYFLNQCFT